MVQPSKLWYNPQNFEGCTITFSLYHIEVFSLAIKVKRIDQQIDNYSSNSVTYDMVRCFLSGFDISHRSISETEPSHVSET